jgi:hypothetical protein
MVRKVATLVAGAAGLVTLVAAATPALALSAAPAWRIVKQVHSGLAGDFTAVVATGTSTGWAFNGNSLAAPTKPTAWKRSGNSWTRAAFPSRRGEVVVAAGATSPSDVWAFTDLGAGSRVLRFDGHKWSVVKTFTKPIGGASVAAGNDVWVFGQPGITQQLGAWHYTGHGWTQVSSNLDGGSALSATSVWAFRGTSVYHYTGRSWTRTKVARLLPAKLSSGLNDPALTGIYAQSARSVYAVGNGNAEDEGGPTAILHYNGNHWSRVAEGSFGYGTQPSQQIAPDGAGGLWLPMPGFGGEPSYLVHYSGGTLTEPALPHGAQGIDVESVANIPGTTEMLGGGFTHAHDNPGVNIVAAILQYS